MPILRRRLASTCRPKRIDCRVEAVYEISDTSLLVKWRDGHLKGGQILSGQTLAASRTDHQADSASMQLGTRGQAVKEVLVHIIAAPQDDELRRTPTQTRVWGHLSDLAALKTRSDTRKEHVLATTRGTAPALH